ncbi:MAG: SIMPL domain-containing protein [Chloroflexi bacterium]|nr:SIMPL domain-containing protein [Chloroflexota bacterium]
MSVVKSVVLAIGLFGIVIFAVACGDDDDEGPASPAVASVAASAVGSAAESAPASTSSSPRAAGGAASAGAAPQSAAPQVASASTEAGIWVTGTGAMSLSPDIALIRLGVESTSPSVTEARDEAATAMDAVVTAVKAQGLSDEDIQTTSFNIWPEYQYQEVITNGIRSNTRVLTGYRVSNDAVIKVRDLDAVGTIIDDVVDAGGDAARINGIDFSIEDPGAYTTELREDAVNAALEHAEHFASLTGVTLGKLVYVTEIGGDTPIVQPVAERAGFAVAAQAAAPATGISGGSLDLTLTVRAGFAIE